MDEAYKFLMNDIGLGYHDAVVVGVSGGPDSMALLNLMVKIKDEIDLKIICAHINHNVRVESKDEAFFIEKYCDDNHIIFESMVILEYGEDNFHNEARTKRYKYFESMVKKYNAKYLLTAHHADDLMETILMRIVRGSTLKGYSGFAKVVNMGSYQILRPMINITKEQILEYNKLNHLKYVTDKSNDKDIYTRNRYRKYVLPFLKTEDHNVHEKFIKFSNTLLEYNNYIDRQLSKVFNQVYNQNNLNILKFKEMDELIQIKIVYTILEGIYQDDLMLIYDSHVELIFGLINSKKPNSFIYLPNNVKVIKSYDILTFNEEISNDNEYEVELASHINLPNGKNIEVIERTNNFNNNICCLDSKTIKLPIHIRTRKQGDRMIVKGMLGSKKIKDIFIDEKIDMQDRNIWPVVVDSEDKVLWLPGLKKSKFDKEKSENYDIILRYY